MKKFIGFILHFIVVMMSIYGCGYLFGFEWYYTITTAFFMWVFIDIGHRLNG